MIATLLGIAAAGGGSLWVARVHRFGATPHPQPPGPLPAVVLGAKVLPDGRPSPALAGRVGVGVALLRAGRASRLVFSGGSPDSRPTEARVMLELAREAGVPAADCRLEEASLCTEENARRCAALFSERAVLLVTCDYHLLRATTWFRAVGFEVFPVASPRQMGAGARVWLTVREAVAMVGVRWRGG